MEGFGGLFGDPDELQKRMAEFADQMQGQQRLAWADNAIGLAVQMTVGEVQYRDGFPWWLILTHVTLAATLWATTVALTAGLLRRSRLR